MRNSDSRRRNERFYDAYLDFDEVLCEYCGVEDDGVQAYRNRMKECVTEAREAIAEWDQTFNRLHSIRERYIKLKNGGDFDDFHGKDEDVVWMQVFFEKLDAKADPLAKYSRMDFKYKTRSVSFWDKLKGMFGM